MLNFTSLSYQPSGDCVGGPHRKIKAWASFPTSLCCRNAVNLYSQALSRHAAATNSLFVNADEWLNCNHSAVFKRQDSVSITTCGLKNLFHGSSHCSSLDLLAINQEEDYRAAANTCRGLSRNDSFDGACGDCSAAVLNARDSVLGWLNVKGNNTEKAICGVAVVVAIAADLLNEGGAVDDLYQCMAALDMFDPGFFQVKYSVFQTLLGIVLASFGLTLLIMLIKYVTKKKIEEDKFSQQFHTKETPTAWSGLYRFSKAEIENAMNFGGERKPLGRGSAGEVYKGILPSGQAVAVKHIYKSNTSDTFLRELEGLTRVRHPNLVSLFGWCTEDGEQYLVYEYCPAGNLAYHLLRRDKVLSWEKRVSILRDCALALRYLHHFLDGCIVHRDIKLTNILLTENLDPKLSDFGLAKILGMEESKVFTDVRGTIGYMDPEYMSNAKLTCASDIYSFGIVALQLLSGQKVIELDLEARDQLTRKAKDVSMGKRPLTDFEDPRLNGNLNTVDFDSILQIAVLCVAKSSKGRPTIDVVYGEMEKAWKNTAAEMKRKRDINSFTATPQSRSLDVIPL